MRVRLQHRSTYRYTAPVTLGTHTIRLSPAPHLATRLLTYNLHISPEPKIHWQLDPWANRIARVDFAEHAEVHELVLQVDASFDLQPINPFDFSVDPRCEQVPFVYPDGLDAELAPFLSPERLDPQVAAWLEEVPTEGYVTDWLVALNRKVAADVGYVLRFDPGIQTPAETLSLRKGSCRDSAWLLVAALRARGFAARFVSGYLIQLEDEGNVPGMPRGLDRDVVDLHAWAEAYVPGAGWVGLDGTSGLLCAEGHIPLVAAVLPEHAAPISGTASGAAERVDFVMQVERLGHEPRPRKPYTDAQVEALLAAGDTVDQRLAEHGVTLSVGGEPTWTSREHPRNPEWITEAIGPTKLGQALRLSAGLHERLAKGGIVLHRMGKHYPGESLPRWAISILWRRDGLPIWNDPSLLALPGSADVGVADRGTAERFATAVNVRLGLTTPPIPAYEDPWWAIRTEADLPEDVDLSVVDLDDAEDRRRLARSLERGLAQPTGFVTPVQIAQGRWSAQAWNFRRERLYLVPGDSPIGLRLPLDRLAGTPETLWLEDPSALTGSLPAPSVQVVHQVSAGSADAAATPAPGPSVRTALCIEPRDGVLHAFLPPVPSTEAFLELIAVLEATAREVGLPVRVEGYPPPNDPRIGEVVVTPDPGVVEVNLPVSTTTRGYDELLQTMADAANHAGLCTERFQLDGRSVGSGGGNHVTLGGATPAESVFLNRPDVTASLLRFVQHHPSLSYLFTGLFIGATSQAPRTDEGRPEMLDELELALSTLGRAGPNPPPWFIDRQLRNLLVDVTGNTHRTEICIDKLYSPFGSTGRLGILEFRAFEMPPNERMATAYVLLLRSLVACFVQRPFTSPLVRWGNRLHDRFLLPHGLWEDLQSVLAFIRSHDLPADPAWFEPFMAYRFPVLGRIDADGVELTVRPALEPWPVLGEEPAGTGTSRFVDSSLERIEVEVRNLEEGRHTVAVNGIIVPLRRTRDPDVRVAGIRFRAWQPPHCLHPHIGIHHPLRIDVIDTWGERSLGAATYHAWHPEGRWFDEPPLTAVEASARRATRVTHMSHQPWPATTLQPPVQASGAWTLDLRWTDGDRPLPHVDPG